MGKIYFDSETTGLHGIAVLFQYAYEDSEPVLWDIWNEKIGDTLDLIEWMLDNDMIFFNAAFDFFHISKIYTTFRLLGDRYATPMDHVSQLGMLEEQARFSDICLKPKRTHDVMLWARKTKFQSLMDRDDIKINRVPTALAWQLAKELEKRLKFDEIYFSRSKEKGLPKWKVFDILRPDNTVNPDFKTIKLKFRASSALKNLYKHVFKPEEEVFTYADIEIGKNLYSQEPGFSPFARAIAPDAPKFWGLSWPALIDQHVAHWAHRSDARKYAANDVIYTRRLYQEAFGSPEPGDVDSTLATMVAACRWHGYAVNLEMLTELKRLSLLKLGFKPDMAEVFKSRPISQKTIIKFGSAVMAPAPSKRYLLDAMNPEERMGFQGGTKKTVLESLTRWRDDDHNRHPVASRAQEILDARTAKKEIEVYEKLLLARRFHASFKVIGTLSSRMAGDNGLNAQGIKHTKNVRAAFPLADSDVHILALGMGIPEDVVRSKIEAGEVSLTVLNGGDYKSFEVSLAAKVFNDPKLDEALLSGKKIHALFGVELFPHMTYEEVCASDGKDPDYYNKGKQGVFSMFYGGETHTLVTRLGVEEEVALQAFEGIMRRFPGIRIFGEKIKAQFGALSQPNGIGTKVEWSEPKDYCESFLGFRRYFTLENRVMKTLFDLARDVPKEWRGIKMKVLRRERIQTPSGAVSSALYGASFGIMSRNIRAAKNHEIQSPGAEITKKTQAEIWTLQPAGIGPWIVQPFQVHDEVMCPTKPGYESQVRSKVQGTVAQFKKQVPLLAIDWIDSIASWAGKKG